MDKIEIPILNNQYKVIVCWGDNKYVRRVLKHYGYNEDKDVFGDAEALTFNERLLHPVIALRRFPETPEDIGTLAHEAVHAVKYIFDHIEEQSSDEIFAHSVGAIVREALEG